MSEATCAKAIEPFLVALSRPTDHNEWGQWGVYVGSHGGRGKTLSKAMRACLMCCDLGSWWRVEGGEGELLGELFDRASREHLGRPLYARGIRARSGA